MDYGFIYTQNNAKYKLKEVVDLTLENYQVIWPRNLLENGQILLDIDPAKDEIIILRRLADKVKYNMSYVSYPMERSDAELIEETKQVQQKNYFGKTEAYF